MIIPLYILKRLAKLKHTETMLFGVEGKYYIAKRYEDNIVIERQEKRERK